MAVETVIGGHVRGLGAALVVGLLSFAGSPVGAAESQPYEIGVAEREAGRLRALLERLSKENLLYQLHLGAVRKQHLHETASEIDRVLEMLREGSGAYAVAPPPTASVRDQIRRVDAKWGHLRTLALASPYDYLRRSSEFLPRQSRRGDPLLVRTFDRLSLELIDEVDRLMGLYDEACVPTGYELCPLARFSGLPVMLAERAAKDLVFVYAEIDSEKSIEHLRETRGAFEAQHNGLRDADLLREAMAPERGSAGQFVAGLWQGIDQEWAWLGSEIDLALEGRAEEIDLQRVLKIQRRLVDDIERFVSAMDRFAASRYGT
jgi:hypothetical protein